MHKLTKQLYARGAGLLSTGLILAGIFAPIAHAQTNPEAGFNFSTSPVVANLQTKPGESTTTKIQIRNNGLTNERVKTGLLKFKSNNQDGSPLMTEPESNDEFLKWVTFSETEFDAEPNVWKTISVTVSPPPTAAFGYYYAVTFSRASEGTQRSTTNLAATVAVPVLLDVIAPGSIRKADITKFNISKNVYEFLPAKFSVTLKNGGNTHVAPRGNIFITKGGKNVALLEVNQGKGNILPDSIRTYTADWTEGSPSYTVKKVDGQPVLDKKKNVVYKLDWSGFDPSKVRFGKYHAKIAMVYDDGSGDVALEGEVDFWVIPWRILGALLLVLLLVGAGLWATLLKPIRNRIKKRPSAKNQTPKQN